MHQHEYLESLVGQFQSSKMSEAGVTTCYQNSFALHANLLSIVSAGVHIIPEQQSTFMKDHTVDQSHSTATAISTAAHQSSSMFIVVRRGLFASKEKHV